MQKKQHRDFSVVSNPAGARVPILVTKFLNASKNTNIQTPLIFFLTFQITRTRKYQFLLFKTRFLNTSPNPADPPDPPEMEHELRLATHQQRAGGQDGVSLNKQFQIIQGDPNQ